MNNKRATKRALLTSVMALVMCVVMLVGTTFAWFTDTASTAVNKIQAGNLDIEVKYTLDGDNWNDLDGATDIFQKGLWEPGHTEVVALKFKNNGNLALKYSINMNIVDETVGVNKFNKEYKLSDYLKVKTLSQEASLIGDICIGMAFSARNDGLGYTATANFKDAAVLDHDLLLTPGEVGNYLIMKVYMPETVGNEANAISTEKAASIRFGLNVVATQVTYEKDSFGNTYDKDATYPVADNEGLKDAIGSATDGSTVVVTSGEYTLSDPAATSKTEIPAGVTIAGAGTDKTTLNVSKDEIKNDNVTLKDMTINGEAPAGNDGALKIGGKNTVIENVIFNGQGFNGDTKGISVTGENLTIRNSKISGAFRGIIFWDNIGGDNLIENCTIDNVIYTFNINAQTVKPGTTLTVKNSTLNGWTSYSGCMTKVSFDKCDLGKSNGYAHLVAYADSEFTGCTFNDGYQIGAGSTGKMLTFTNCKLGDGTVITAENFAEKLGDVDNDMKGCTVIVDGATVNWN